MVMLSIEDEPAAGFMPAADSVCNEERCCCTFRRDNRGPITADERVSSVAETVGTATELALSERPDRPAGLWCPG